MHLGRNHSLKSFCLTMTKHVLKEIKLMNNSNLSLPNVVDGITGSNNIVNYVEISL